MIALGYPMHAALTFGAASGDLADCGSATSLDALTTSGFTVWLWGKRTATGANQHLITKDNSTSTSEWLFAANNSPSEGTVEFIAWRSGTRTNFISSTVAMPQDAWAFVVVTFDDAASPKVHIYYASLTAAVAEVAYNTSDAGTGTVNTDYTANLYIGNVQRDPTNPFKGQIARVGVIASALSLGQLESLRNDSRNWTGGAFFSLLQNGVGTHPDWSGNVNNCTTTGATSAPDVPLGPAR